MKKYLFGALVLFIITAILFNFYKYREQNLADLLKINEVEKILITSGNKTSGEFKLAEVDDETINKLSNYFEQYQVKLTKKHGFISDNENEQFEIFLEYKDGEIKKYLIERDVVVSDRVYEVVNAPLDYQWIMELEGDFISK